MKFQEELKKARLARYRDGFAKAALIGILSNGGYKTYMRQPGALTDDVARDAYAFADAMLIEREAREEI